MAPTHVIALRKPEPTAQQLEAEFSDCGFEGTLADGATLGTSRLTPNPTTEARRQLVAGSFGKVTLREDFAFFTLEGDDDVEDLACRLASLSGGYVLLEDGEAISLYDPPAPKKKRSRVDVSIPSLVQERFGKSQAQYCLCPRKEPSARLSSLVKAAGVAKGHWYEGDEGDSTSLVLAIGEVHLSSYFDSSYWADELKSLGLSRPEELYRTSFKHWHTKDVPPQDWQHMLAVVCGLARSCDGVLYHPGGSRFDFAIPEADQMLPGDPSGLINRAKTAKGDALAEVLEQIARQKVVGALEALDFDELCTRTDRGVVESVWAFLKR